MDKGSEPRKEGGVGGDFNIKSRGCLMYLFRIKNWVLTAFTGMVISYTHPHKGEGVGM